MRWIAGGMGTLLALGLVLHSIPYLVRDQVVIWLRDQGVEDARFRALNIDWFSGRVELLGLKARSEGRFPLELDRLDLDLDYAALFDKQLRVQRVLVEGLRGGLVYRDDEQWLGPINLSALTNAQPEDESAATTEPSSWSLGLDGLALKAVDWRLRLEDQAHHLELDQLALGSVYLWQPDQETALSLSGRINGAPFSLDTRSVPLAENKRGDIAIQIEQLPVQSLASAFVPELEATLTTDLQVNLALKGNSLRVAPRGRIQVDRFRYDSTSDIQVGQLVWQGDADLALEQFQLAKLTLDGSLELQQPRFAQDALDAQLQSLNWQGQVMLDDGESISIDVDGAVKGGGLALSQQAQEALDLTVNDLAWQGRVALAMAEGGSMTGRHQLALNQLQLGQGESLKLTMNRVDLQTRLSTRQFDQWGWQEMRLALEGAELSMAPSMGSEIAALEVQSQGEYQISDGRLSAQVSRVGVGRTDLQVGEGAPLARFESLAVNDLTLALPLDLSLASAELKALDIDTGGEPLFASLGSGRLEQLVMDNERVGIGRIDLEGLVSRLTLDEQMRPLELEALTARLESVNSGQSAPESQVEAPGADVGEPLRVSVDEARIGGDSAFYFTDRSTQPVFDTRITIREAVIRDIDTAGSAQSEFSLSAGIDQFAELKAEGAVNLIGSPRSGHWNAELTGMELPALSPYSIKYTGYFLKSGQLALDLKGTLDQDELSGENHIRLHRLAVDPVDQEQIQDFQARISMPLGTAVAVLQDDNDNIDLDVPISGSLDDPEFDYQSIINRVAGKGVKQGVLSYLTKALQPYGALISLAQTAIKASKTGAFINLEPVGFEPGSDLPVAGATDYLEQLAGLLEQRSALRLNLCGIAVESDRTLLGETLREANEKADEPLEPDALAAELDKQLAELAENRAVVLKQRLQQRIDGERLFLCYPQVDQEGEPRVEPAL
ncbi:MAG: hypothetical protein CMI01_11175 [Oceanospirillaceae bacterium]|nr:hypothetical protein [Oceanospirillaceae bacterium]